MDDIDSCVDNIDRWLLDDDTTTLCDCGMLNPLQDNAIIERRVVVVTMVDLDMICCICYVVIDVSNLSV